jgi:predicted DNA-binding transcriptional regulator YafY
MVSRSSMTSPSTLDELRRLLTAGRELTLDELKNQLGVSRRHVRRLIKQLREEGIDVKERHEGRLKRFYLAAEDQAPPSASVPLTESQLLALSVAAEAAQSMLHGTPLADPLDEAVEKIVGASAGRVVTFEPERTPANWHFTPTGESRIDPDIFGTLTRAVRACEMLTIDYHAASSGRTSRGRRVNPYLIARIGSTWLLTAYCHESQRVLEFSIAAIESARGAGSYFQRPADFHPDLHYRDRFGAMNGDEVHVVRLHVDADKAAHFHNKTYHPTQQIERTLPDGSLLVSYEVAGLEEIAAFVRSWGPGVTALAPEVLRRRVQSDLRTALARYENGGTA